jgi:hypothetical protein
MAGTMIAADRPAALTPSRFNTDTVAAQVGQATAPGRAFTEQTAPARHISKKKVVLILAGIGAAVAGIVVATRSSGGSGNSGGVTPPLSGGGAGSVLVINGVPQ